LKTGLISSNKDSYPSKTQATHFGNFNSLIEVIGSLQKKSSKRPATKITSSGSNRNSSSKHRDFSIKDLIDPFTDIVTNVLWKFVKKDDQKEEHLESMHEGSQVADVYENV
jgi:hypothetical protein